MCGRTSPHPPVAAPDRRRTIRSRTRRPTLAWVAPRDIAEVAVTRLLSTGWSGRCVQAVHGPADLTWPQAAEIVSTAAGHPLRAERIRDEAMRDILHNGGIAEASSTPSSACRPGCETNSSPNNPAQSTPPPDHARLLGLRRAPPAAVTAAGARAAPRESTNAFSDDQLRDRVRVGFDKLGYCLWPDTATASPTSGHLEVKAVRETFFNSAAPRVGYGCSPSGSSPRIVLGVAGFNRRP